MCKKFSILIFGVILILQSCAVKYTTPGESVNISALADEDIAKILSNEPAAEFPVNIAIARIQTPEYTNYKYQNPYLSKQEQTNFSMILTRDAEEEEAFEKIQNLEGVDQASPFNRLLLPYNNKSIKDLRMAAAKMKAEILLVYTFNTEFIIDTKNYGPQNVFALGYLKNKEVKVITTASAAIFDVQTEYLYGLAETTAEETKKSNFWKKGDEVDDLRIVTERKAINELVDEIETVWTDIRSKYAAN